MKEEKDDLSKFAKVAVDYFMLGLTGAIESLQTRYKEIEKIKPNLEAEITKKLYAKYTENECNCGSTNKED